jgi:hypothetical protein
MTGLLGPIGGIKEGIPDLPSLPHITFSNFGCGFGGGFGSKPQQDPQSMQTDILHLDF